MSLNKNITIFIQWNSFENDSFFLDQSVLTIVSGHIAVQKRLPQNWDMLFCISQTNSYYQYRAWRIDNHYGHCRSDPYWIYVFPKIWPRLQLRIKIVGVKCEHCSVIVAAEKHDVVRKANRYDDKSENMPRNNHFGFSKIYCSPVAGKNTGEERYWTLS